MVFNLIKLIIFVFVFSGCSYPQNKEKVIYLKEVRGSEAFKENVITQLKKIELYMNKPVFFQGGNYPIIITQGEISEEVKNIEIKKEALLREKGSQSQVLGYSFTEESYCDVIIWDKIEREDHLRLMLLHEVGHCLDLDHNQYDYGGVMDLNLSDDLTENVKDIPNFLGTLESITKSYLRCWMVAYNNRSPTLIVADPFKVCPRSNLAVF